MTNVQLVETLHEVWCNGNLDMIERVYAPDFIGHWPRSSEVPLRRGVESLRLGLQRTRTAFPDFHERVVDMFGAGDKVTSRYVSTGTHLGPYLGIIPTGRQIEIEEISIFRCTDGRVAEQWCMFDELARLQQLGVDDVQLRKVLKL